MCCGGWIDLRRAALQTRFGKMAENEESLYLVHTLYKPPDGVEPTAVIVFFHGLSRGTKEWHDTWLTRGPKNSQVCWPAEWLPKQFEGKVAVLAPAYDASPHGVNHDVKDISHNLRVSLIRELAELGDPQKAVPIVLVGHSFGGLVIKSLVCQAHYIAKIQRCENDLDRRNAADCQFFLNNLKGAVFFSVPHSGTKEDFLKFWTQFSKGSGMPRKGRLAGIMKNLTAFSRQMEQLTVDFENYVPQGMSIFAFCEGLPIRGTESLVSYASAVRTARKSFCKVEEVGHFEVCRPLNQKDKIYREFINFLDEATGTLKQSSTCANADELEELQ